MSDKTQDRELLENAAKAAGITHAICYEADSDEEEPHAYCRIAKGTYWRPLTDDGDRYRLAKQLKMTLDFDMCCVHSGMEIYQWGGAITEGQAVLIAAAEIGKAKS